MNHFLMELVQILINQSLVLRDLLKDSSELNKSQQKKLTHQIIQTMSAVILTLEQYMLNDFNPNINIIEERVKRELEEIKKQEMEQAQ